MGSALLKESVNSSVGDDDKIYFFFTERSQEQIAYPSQTKVSRIARVCKVRDTDQPRFYEPHLFEGFAGLGELSAPVAARSRDERVD